MAGTTTPSLLPPPASSTSQLPPLTVPSTQPSESRLPLARLDGILASLVASTRRKLEFALSPLLPQVVASLSTPLSDPEGMATRAAAARVLSVLAHTSGRPSAKIASHLARVRSASALFACLQQVADQHLYPPPASRAETTKLLEAVLRALSAIRRLMGPLAGMGSLLSGAGPGPYIPIWGDEENEGLPSLSRRSAKGKGKQPVTWTPGFYPYQGPRGPFGPFSSDESRSEWILMRCMLVGQLDAYVFPANLRLLLSCVFLGDPMLASRPPDDAGRTPSLCPLPHSPCTKAREFSCAIVADIIASRFDNELGLQLNAARLFRTREDLATRYGLGVDDPQSHRSGWPAVPREDQPSRVPRNKDESSMLRTYILSFDPSLHSLFPDAHPYPGTDGTEDRTRNKRKLPLDSESSDRPTQHLKRDQGLEPPTAAQQDFTSTLSVPLPPAGPLTALRSWIQADLPVLNKSPLQDALLQILVSLLASMYDSPHGRAGHKTDAALPEMLRTVLAQYRAPFDQDVNFYPWSCSPSHCQAQEDTGADQRPLQNLPRTESWADPSGLFYQRLRGLHSPLPLMVATVHRFAYDAGPISLTTACFLLTRLGELNVLATSIRSKIPGSVFLHSPLPVASDEVLSPETKLALILREEEGVLLCLARPRKTGDNMHVLIESKLPDSVFSSPSLGVRTAAFKVVSAHLPPADDYSSGAQESINRQQGGLQELLSARPVSDEREQLLQLAPDLFKYTFQAIQRRWAAMEQVERPTARRSPYWSNTWGNALISCLCRAVQALAVRPSEMDLVLSPDLANRDICLLALELVHRLPLFGNGILQVSCYPHLGPDVIFSLARADQAKDIRLLALDIVAHLRWGHPGPFLQDVSSKKWLEFLVEQARSAAASVLDTWPDNQLHDVAGAPRVPEGRGCVPRWEIYRVVLRLWICTFEKNSAAGLVWPTLFELHPDVRDMGARVPAPIPSETLCPDTLRGEVPHLLANPTFTAFIRVARNSPDHVVACLGNHLYNLFQPLASHTRLI